MRLHYPAPREWDANIAAKERWAAKMAGRARPAVRSTDRLPPGQRLVTNFPVLDLGIHPDVPPDQWRLKIHGLVENPVTLDWDEFMALPHSRTRATCTARPPGASMTWRGKGCVLLQPGRAGRTASADPGVILENRNRHRLNAEDAPGSSQNVLEVGKRADGARGLVRGLGTGHSRRSGLQLGHGRLALESHAPPAERRLAQATHRPVAIEIVSQLCDPAGMEEAGPRHPFDWNRRKHERKPRVRRRCGLDGGSLILIEEDAQGVQRRTVVAVPADLLGARVAPAARAEPERPRRDVESGG